MSWWTCSTTSNGELVRAGDAVLTGSFFDQSGYFFGVRNINCMAGSFYLYFVAVRALGVHAFQVGVDGFVGRRHQVPARLQFPGGIGNGSLGYCKS